MNIGPQTRRYPPPRAAGFLAWLSNDRVVEIETLDPPFSDFGRRSSLVDQVLVSAVSNFQRKYIHPFSFLVLLLYCSPLEKALDGEGSYCFVFSILLSYMNDIVGVMDFRIATVFEYVLPWLLCCLLFLHLSASFFHSDSFCGGEGRTIRLVRLKWKTVIDDRARRAF